jgi:hypothetical protein
MSAHTIFALMTKVSKSMIGSEEKVAPAVENTQRVWEI